MCRLEANMLEKWIKFKAFQMPGTIQNVDREYVVCDIRQFGKFCQLQSRPIDGKLLNRAHVTVAKSSQSHFISCKSLRIERFYIERTNIDLHVHYFELHFETSSMNWQQKWGKNCKKSRRMNSFRLIPSFLPIIFTTPSSPRERWERKWEIWKSFRPPKRKFNANIVCWTANWHTTISIFPVDELWCVLNKCEN